MTKRAAKTPLEKWEIDQAHVDAEIIAENPDCADGEISSYALVLAFFSPERNLTSELKAYYQCIATKLDELRGI